MTMIELLIVVAILGILASVALPAFIEYRFRARQTEAVSNIAAIKVSQEAHFALYDSYANIVGITPPGPPSSTSQVWAPPPCPLGCTRLTPAACTSFACISFRPSADVYFRYVSPSATFGPGLALNEYAIGADGDADNNGLRAGYTYQTANGGGGVGLIVDPISGCPAMPADNIHRCTPSAY